jgi:hypothetical protein
MFNQSQPPNTAVSTRERTLCAILGRICQLLALVGPAGVALYVAFSGTNALIHALPASVGFRTTSVSTTTAVFALAIALLPLLTTSRALWTASTCFANFSRGEYVNRRNALLFRDFARWMLWASLLHVAMTPALSALISVAQGNPLAISLSLTSQDIMLTVFAALVWQTSRVFAQATALAEENAQFV